MPKASQMPAAKRKLEDGWFSTFQRPGFGERRDESGRYAAFVTRLVQQALGAARAPARDLVAVAGRLAFPAGEHVAATVYACDLDRGWGHRRDCFCATGCDWSREWQGRFSPARS